MDNLHESNNYNHYCGIDISDKKFIGQGHQGRVYLLPDNKVIKIFNRSYSCQEQLFILQKVSTSGYFPKVYDHDNYSIVMEFINGQLLGHYLKDNQLTKTLSFQLVELINEFERFGFTRLDMRLAHIFVQANGNIRVIDPRGSFRIVQEYPILMLKGLDRLGILNQFFDQIKYKYPEKFSKWSNMYNSYR